MSTASGRQHGSEVLRNMGADECSEVHPGGRRSKRECCNTAKFPLGTRPGSELIGAEEAERAWPQLVRCAVPYAWCPISEDEDKRENISGEEANSAPSGDLSSGPKPRPERGPRPWEASGSGRGAEAKTSVMRECIAEMRQSFGHMHQNKAEKSRKASEGRRVVRGCAAKLHERKEMKLSEAPKFTDQYRSNRLKAIGCERALVQKGLGQPHQRADGAVHKCARTERSSRKQTQGSEDRGWLHRARMSSRGAVGVPRSKRGDAGRVKGSEYREWLQRAWMRSRSADGALGRQPEGAGKICGQVETGCRPNLKPALSGWHGAWWPCGRRAQPHLGVDRSTDAPERKGRSEVQDDKTPRRSNNADGPGRRVMTSSGGVGPGDDIINLSRSDSDEIKRARDVTLLANARDGTHATDLMSRKTWQEAFRGSRRPSPGPERDQTAGWRARQLHVNGGEGISESRRHREDTTCTASSRANASRQQPFQRQLRVRRAFIKCCRQRDSTDGCGWRHEAQEVDEGQKQGREFCLPRLDRHEKISGCGCHDLTATGKPMAEALGLTHMQMTKMRCREHAGQQFG
ncbi:hypothetical protein GGX14DRAFT_393913 [Mycena pura]|uniref:Uncharacterized protein n=1 Tax=Mycena pura TaxID=153505 RepID=A0AAD6VFJ4_9AGAR|nr:hypothetical protein GGX14DRAFT_393913 [Mycena pura]